VLGFAVAPGELRDMAAQLSEDDTPLLVQRRRDEEGHHDDRRRMRGSHGPGP
jgi:hypothetical protein